MKKINLISSLFLLFAFLLSACKDDVIVVPEQIPEDTTDVYDWTVDTIYGYDCANIYAADSDNVFIVATPEPLFYNGKDYSIINLMDPQFICVGVSGYDKNNVFFGGGTRGTYWGDPVLKKWMNGNITTYTLTGDSGVHIGGNLIEGPNQAWFSTGERYKVYYFDDGNFTQYTLDSGFEGAGFYRDISGELYAFPVKFLNETDCEYRYYKLINDKFTLIGRDTVTQTSNMNTGMFRCGADLLRRGRGAIFYFNDSKWDELCSIPDFKPFILDGISRNNFVCYGLSGTYSWEIYTWNGIEWKRERSKNIYHGLADPCISVTNKTVDIILSAQGINYHLRGRPKK